MKRVLIGAGIAGVAALVAEDVWCRWRWAQTRIDNLASDLMATQEALDIVDRELVSVTERIDRLFPNSRIWNPDAPPVVLPTPTSAHCDICGITESDARLGLCANPDLSGRRSCEGE